MVATRMLTGVTLLATLLCVVSASQNSITDNNTGRKGNKKVDDMVNDMYTAFMMTKNVMSMMLMFVSPIIQIKGFGLSVLNTLINIGRFLLQMQATKRIQEMSQTHHATMTPHVFHGEHNVHTDHHKDLVNHHNDHEDIHNDHDNSVYIIKHHGHDHDTWEEDYHNQPLTNDHNVIWAKEPDNHWKTADHFYSAPSLDQKWVSSQKLAYYAPSPIRPFSSRLGLPSPPLSPPEHISPPTLASYEPGDLVGQIYPFFTPNLTRSR